VPATYCEARPATRRAVYVHLPDGLVTGELLCWLRHAEHGWYGYVTWCHRRTLHTEPVPAAKLEPYPFRSR